MALEESLNKDDPSMTSYTNFRARTGLQGHAKQPLQSGELGLIFNLVLYMLKHK